MFLDELPTELLRMVIGRISPRERLPLRRTSRRFCSLVETEGVLPFNPIRIYIDFWRQIIAVFMQEENDDFIALGNEPVQNGELLPCQSRSLDEFWRVEDDIETMSSIRDRFYDVGDNWTKYVNDYLRRLNKHFNLDDDYSRIIVILGDEIPPQLYQLSIRFAVVDIQAQHPIWTDRSLPDSLVAWTGNVTDGSESTITVCFAPMSPNQLDIIARIPSMFVYGCVDDEGAMHLLEMFHNQTFPNMDCWYFKLHRNSPRFLSALKSRHNLEPIGKWNIGRTVHCGRNRLLLTESDYLYVHIGGQRL